MKFTQHSFSPQDPPRLAVNPAKRAGKARRWQGLGSSWQFGTHGGCLALVLTLVFGGSAIGQTTNSWVGGTSGVLTLSGNYAAGVSVAADGNPSALFVFGRAVTTRTALTATAEFKANRLLFEGASSFTLSNTGQFNFIGASNGITQSSSATQTIAGGIKVSDGPLTLSGDGAGLVTLSGTSNDYGTKGITKTGSSAFLLSSGNALNSGTVAINGGTLALSSTTTLSGVIQLRGGVLATSGTFSRAFGTGATNVNFGAGGGGFAAFGGALTVSTALGTYAATNTGNGLALGRPLILGSSIANNVVTLSSNLGLGGAAREIRLVDNVNSAADAAVMSGVISGTAGTGGLNLTGAGNLTLSNTNTYTGVTTIGNGVTLSVATIGLGGAAGNLGAATNAAANLVLGGGTLQYTGASATASTDRAFTLTAATTSSISVSNAASVLTMTGASAATTGGLTKAGAGTLVLSAANAHTGITTVNAGVLRVTNAAGLGSSGAGTTVASGAALELSGGITIGAESLSLAGSGIASGGALRSVSGNNNYGGAISAAVASSITADAGVLTLNGVLTSASTTTFGGAGSVVAAGGVTGGGNVIKTGIGALTLAVNNGQANTTVSQGQLNINSLAALGTPAGTLTLAAGSLIDNTSGAAVTVANPKSIALGSDFTFVGSNNLDLGTGTVTLAGNTAINVSASELIFSGNVAGSGFGITKTGAGTLRLDGLTGAGSFTGSSWVNAGRLVIGGTSTLGGNQNTLVTVADGAFLEIEAGASAGSVTLVSRPDGLITSSVVVANQDFSTSGTLGPSNAKFDGTIDIASGVIIEASANLFGVIPAEPTAGRIVFESNSTLNATAGFTINANQGVSLAGGTANFEVSPSQALIIESSVAGSGGVAKVGSGNMRLTGVNTYTGGTVVSAGILGITSGEALGDVSGALKLDGGTLVGAQVASGEPISAVTIATERSLVLTNGKTSGIDAQSGLSLRYDGVIGEENGAGAVAGLRIGSSAARTGTVILGGNNTYQGATTVDFGTLSVSSIGNGGVAGNLGAASNAAANLVLGGGTLQYNGASASTDRAFTLTADTASGINVATADTTLTMSGATAATSGALTKTGAGTLQLTGANGHTGATTVADGKLILNGSTSAASAVGVSSGATLAGSGTVGGDTTIASGAALAPGNSPGVLTVEGATNFTSGSMFEWEIDTAQTNPETNRGIAYDGLNTTAVTGSGAIFKVMLTGTQNFTDDFWNQDRTWTDIFKSADGSSILSGWASVFSGGFQYSYNGQTVAPTTQGFFTTTGSSLTWSAVPEPSNLLAGMLAASALLRRRRSA